MNKEDYDKLSTFNKIDFDIAMKMYMEHNHHIAIINDNLGDIYSYRDLEEAERAEERDTLEEYKKALKQKCDAIDKAIEYIENDLSHATSNGKLHRKHLLNIFKGSDKE